MRPMDGPPRGGWERGRYGQEYGRAMLARLKSAALRGVVAEPVDVEVDLARGLPGWSMVGLPDAAVREARDRVRAALLNSGFDFPLRYITVNLAPAELRKEGAHFDLPVAVALLLASEQIGRIAPLPFMIGELALDGKLNRIAGALPLLLFAREAGFAEAILPTANAAEVAMVDGMRLLPAESLLQVAEHLVGRQALSEHMANESGEHREKIPDLSDIRGQLQARRALEIAAAGGHHLLMSGSPGVGKSMLATRLPGILPLLSREQRLEVSRIYSIIGFRDRHPLSAMPPFRQPHHSASDAAIIGGGTIPQPGEVSRAHFGVLFLDELPEFKRQVLEVLRQPLEEGKVCIARAADSITFPAEFQLIAAMNPCPCGYLGHPHKSCSCSPLQCQRYRQRISGPLLDRFDLHVHVPPVERSELAGMSPGETSEAVAARVAAARQKQYRRLGEGRVNGRMSNTEIERVARPDAAGQALLEQAMLRFSLSARAFHRLLKVARTIADLAGEEQVCSSHVAEALSYRDAGLG